VALYGLFGIGNTGNDASLQVMLDALRKRLPGVRFTIVTREPDNVPGAPDVTVRPIRADAAIRARWLGPLKKLINEANRWRLARSFLKTADCLLIPGTGTLDDFQASTASYAYPLWLWGSSAKAAGKPLMMVSIGAGPVERPWSRRLFSAVAGMAAFRSYRDENSRIFTHDVLKVDTSADAVTPDLVMAMEVNPPPPVAGEPQTIGVGVINYHSWRGDSSPSVYEAYMAKLTAFCRDRLAEGKSIRILLGETHDSPVADDLAARLNAPERVTAARVSTLAGLCEEIGKTDMVVASRYHTIIAAMLCGRPAISIGYARKNRAVMKDFGLGRFCQEIGDFDPALLNQHYQAILADAPAIRQRQLARRAELRSSVEAHLDLVASRISAHQDG
jgi:polysaccharide pyruvyl transferase WcaK-like protein